MSDAVFALLFLYFVPTFLAVSRQSLWAGTIFAFNLLLGWTLVGWFVALVWAFVAATAQSRMKKCPRCAEAVQPDAQICRFCSHSFVVEARSALRVVR